MADDLKIGVDYSEVNQATKAVDQLGDTAGRTARKTKRFAATGLQQVGYQVGDFAVQVQSGTNAMVALGQQGSQLLGILGPFGALAGAALAIATAVGMASTSTKELSFDFKRFTKDMGDAFAEAKPVVDAIGKALAYVGSFAMDVINAIITGTAKLFTAISHLPAVAKEAASKFVLRFSLIRTNIDILGAQFSIFMNNVGKSAEVGMNNFNNIVSGTFLGTVAYIKEVWGSLGTVLSNAMKTAAANTVKVIENMLNSIVGQINKLSDAINSILPERFADYGLGKIGDFNFGADEMFKKTDDNFGSLGQKASEAFWEAYSQAQNYAVTGTYDELIKGQEYAIGMLKRQAADYAQELDKPNQALQDMYDAIAAIETIDLGSYFEFVAKKAKEEVGKVKDEVNELAEAMGKNLENAMMSFIDHTKSGEEKFREFANAVISDLYRILVVQELVNAAKSAMTGGSFLGSLFGGFMAKGGPVSTEKAYIVGEKGPELFVPSSNGSIVPNDKLGGGGNVTVVQHLNISTGVQQTVRSEIRQMMPQIAESAKSAVLDSKRRGGNYGRALA
jgi:hypothetical protein